MSDVLDQIMRLKYGPDTAMGWGPKLRLQFGYYTPDDLYEAFLLREVSAETSWLDVGCGRGIFQYNLPTAKLLAERCRRLVGLDPSDNIDDNTLVHHRVKCMIEEYQTQERFDLITLRMVAEHIGHPEVAVPALAKLCNPGGRVVIYTVWKWSPASIVAAVTPMWVHHIGKTILWSTEERDTFPIEYKMNTKSQLAEFFRQAGMTQQSFQYLDDCRSFQRSKTLSFLELSLRKLLQLFGLRYPERCILAVFQKPV